MGSLGQIQGHASLWPCEVCLDIAGLDSDTLRFLRRLPPCHEISAPDRDCQEVYGFNKVEASNRNHMAPAFN